MQVAIDLYRDADSMKAEATLVFSAAVADNFSFVLSSSLSIDAISTNGKSLDFNVESADDSFRSLNKITVLLQEKADAINILYSGKPEGYHTIVDDDVFAVNFYSAWYPVCINTEIAAYTVRFHDDYYTHMVNAAYDTDEKLWLYQPRDFDCNILAYKTASSLSDEKLTLYYSGEINSLAKMYFDAYSNAAAFCESIYTTKRLKKSTLAILPKGNAYDGYCRSSLIVLGGFVDNENYVRHLVAHEIAHNWCIGADFTWEDWLNETTAEWTALLYELKSGNSAEFNNLINKAISSARSMPPIRTADGSRPDGVHVKGTALFYEVYTKHGYDAVAAMLKIFDELETKTTEAFIREISSQLGSEIASIITSGIDAA